MSFFAKKGDDFGTSWGRAPQGSPSDLVFHPKLAFNWVILRESHLNPVKIGPSWTTALFYKCWIVCNKSPPYFGLWSDWAQT